MTEPSRVVQPTPVAETTPVAGPVAPPASSGWLRRLGRWVRAEDWLLVAWVAVAAPSLVRLQAPSAGPFDAGRPVDGLIDLAAVLGAVICLAGRRADPADGTAFGQSGAVGPFVGGLLLIVVSAATALELSSTVGLGLAAFAAVVAILVRLRVPAFSAPVRRALVTPYVLVTGGVFWRLIDAVTGGGDLTTQLRAIAPVDLGSAAPVIGFLVAFSAVYYAMLIYAPRQVAEREGGPLAWLLRYGLFVLGIALGAAWLAALGS